MRSDDGDDDLVVYRLPPFEHFLGHLRGGQHQGEHVSEQPARHGDEKAKIEALRHLSSLSLSELSPHLSRERTLLDDNVDYSLLPFSLLLGIPRASDHHGTIMAPWPNGQWNELLKGN